MSLKLKKIVASSLWDSKPAQVKEWTCNHNDTGTTIKGKYKTYKPTIRIPGSTRIDDLESKPLKLSCRCADFQFTYAQVLHDKGALLGEPPEQTVTNKPRNPGKKPGMCKHLHGLVLAYGAWWDK